MADELIALYYELLSGGSNTGISVLQFLNLRHVLSFKLSLTTDSTPLDAVNGVLLTPLHLLVDNVYNRLTLPLPRPLDGEGAAGWAKGLLDAASERGWLQAVNNLDVVLLAFSLSDYKLISITSGSIFVH